METTVHGMVGADVPESVSDWVVAVKSMYPKRELVLSSPHLATSIIRPEKHLRTHQNWGISADECFTKLRNNFNSN